MRGRAVADAAVVDVIVEGLTDTGDADVVVRLFSREHGRFSAYAKAARKSRTRFAGLQAPALGTATVRPRRSELWELVSVDLSSELRGLERDLRGYGHAGYLVEITARSLPEAFVAPAAFDRLQAALRTIAQAGPRAALLRAYELQLLMELGLLPALPDPDGAAFFDPVAGDLCRGGPHAVPFSAEVQAAARALLEAPASSAPELPLPLLRSVSLLFRAYVRRLGGPPLRSVAFLASLGSDPGASPDASADVQEVADPSAVAAGRPVR